MIDKFKAAFREEAFELLSQLEDTLLELESEPLNGELINAAFRAIHTVKGSSAMFGFDTISRFTHEVESVLDQCRAGTIPITKDFIGLTLKARDHLRRLLEYDEPPPTELAAEGDSLLLRYRGYASGGGGPRGPRPAETQEPQPAEAPEKLPPAESTESSAGTAPSKAKAPVFSEESSETFRISFKPHADIFKDGTKVLNLLEELGELGEIAVYPHSEAIPGLRELDPESCYCSWELLLTTVRGENAIRDVFIFVEDRAEIKIERLNGSLDAEGRAKRLGEILFDRGLVSASDLKEALGSQRKLGEVLVEKRIVTRPEIDSALLEQEHLKKVHEKSEVGMASIRVASDKLDALVDLVGELVTLQARLAQTSLEIEEASLASISEQFERLISQLRDNTMSIRMLPIGSTFNKFRRVVRDLSIELGKEAELLTEGADTELDKTVIEKLGDPLVHIIRNSLDHGIEKPEERKRLGKTPGGSIRLSARHSGAYVLIQVADDGKGLDAEAIRQKGLERGLIAPGQELGEQELFQLIFAPGFSTARTVSTVSGRGVGMDVVKREIDSLGGSVHLESQSGQGMKVTLKIPLTLAIIDGLLVRIGAEFFVVPLSSVDGCIEIRRTELEALGERRILSYREDLVPFVSLRSLFACAGEEPPIEQIVIAQAQEARVGFVVDQVIGDYQTVIKPLGRMFKDAEGVSGATILGDGTVALILDVNRLSELVQRGEKSRAQLKGNAR